MEAKMSWNNIDKLSDFKITYLLYKEGKNIQTIAVIRNISLEEVQQHLIRAKEELFIKAHKSRPLLERLLEITKEQRKDVLKSLTEDEVKGIKKQILERYKFIDNPDDRMVIIWIIGELGEGELLPLIYKDIKHHHGNIRRMVCSAINKIGDPASVTYLHRALTDSKPQVRQYSAKALGKLGNIDTIDRLKGLINNPKEKEYVKRSFHEAIESIKRRLEEFS